MPDSRASWPPMERPERGMLAVGMPRSLLPRPKPLITGPRSLSGKGGEGAEGPAMGSRDLVGGGIVVGLIWYVFWFTGRMGGDVGYTVVKGFGDDVWRMRCEKTFGMCC